MMEGLAKWYHLQVSAILGEMTPAEQKRFFNFYQKKFHDKVIAASGIVHLNQPMYGYRSGKEEDPELGLWNPYSRISCFVLYLYSMELGSPPLFAELN